MYLNRDQQITGKFVLKIIFLVLLFLGLIIEKNNILALNFGLHTVHKSQRLLTPIQDTPTIPPATQQSTLAIAQTLTISATPTGYLNVRNSPALSGSLITKVSPGQTFTYSDVQNGWYKIDLGNSQTGWIFGQYVKINSSNSK